MRRETGLRLSARCVVAAAEERAARESQARVTGDARTWVAGALAASASTKEERVGPCGSSRAESDLAVGHDEDLGRSCSGLGVPGVRDRLLYAGDRGLESLASLSDRRRARRGGADRARTAARGQPRGSLDADHGQWNAVHFFKVPGNAPAARHHASADGLS